MPWKYADASHTIVTDGNACIPLNSETGESRRLKMLIANGLEVCDFVALPAGKPQYTLTEVVELLISKGLIPPKG